jgi:hypothetical protein
MPPPLLPPQPLAPLGMPPPLAPPEGMAPVGLVPLLSPLGIAVGRVPVMLPVGRLPVGMLPLPPLPPAPPLPPLAPPEHCVLLLVPALLVDELEHAASRPRPAVLASATAPKRSAIFRFERVPVRAMRFSPRSLSGPFRLLSPGASCRALPGVAG